MRPAKIIIFLCAGFLLLGIATSVQAISFTHEFSVDLEKDVKDDHTKYKYEGAFPDPGNVGDGLPEYLKLEFKFYNDGTLKTKVEEYNIETILKNGKLKDEKVGKVKTEFITLNEGEFQYFAVLEEENNFYPDNPFFIHGNFFEPDGDSSGTFKGIISNVNPIPEPATLFLLGGGILGIAIAGRKLKK